MDMASVYGQNATPAQGGGGAPDKKVNASRHLSPGLSIMRRCQAGKELDPIGGRRAWRGRRRLWTAVRITAFRAGPSELQHPRDIARHLRMAKPPIDGCPDPTVTVPAARCLFRRAAILAAVQSLRRPCFGGARLIVQIPPRAELSCGIDIGQPARQLVRATGVTFLSCTRRGVAGMAQRMRESTAAR